MKASSLNVFNPTVNLSGVPSYPQWIKKTFTYDQFSIAGLTNDLELISLAAKGVIHGVVIKQITQFSGTLVTSLTASIGPSTNFVKYAAAQDLSTATPVLFPSSTMGIENYSAATSIRIKLISIGANLSALAAGAVEVQILVSVLNN